MGVKIKNWIIPESCDDCPFSMVNVKYGKRKCWFTDLDVTDLFLCRHDLCPMESYDDQEKGDLRNGSR